MTFRHRAGVRPYTSPCGFAESCVFGKQSLGPFRCGRRGLGERVPPPAAAPLLPKLRGHCAEFLHHGSPDRLGMLYPSTCVGFGTGTWRLPRGFSRKRGLTGFTHSLRRHASALRAGRICLPCGLRAFTGTSRTPPGYPSPSPHRSIAPRRWCGNVHPLCIGYACRPRLSSRLTLGGLALPRKPWTCGGGVFHSPRVTHASIRAPGRSTKGHPFRFAADGTLPYHRIGIRSSASVPCLAP